MQTLNLHYHADGTVDFDFYRRRAARERRRVRRVVFRHYLRTLRAGLQRAISAVRKTAIVAPAAGARTA